MKIGHVDWLLNRIKELELEVNDWRAEVQKWQKFYKESEESHLETKELLYSAISENKRYQEAFVVNQVDVKWLINRVEKLEETNKKLIESTTAVANENHRYKLALEFYANKKNYDLKQLERDKHVIPVFKDCGEKARQALEEGGYDM